MQSEAIWDKVRPRLWLYLFQRQDLYIVQEYVDGVTPDTIGGWLVNSRPPNGYRLIMLWHLLHALGIESEELNELPPYNRFLGELLTFGALRNNLEVISDIVGVKNSQTVFQILRGQKPSNPRYTLDELREKYGERIQRELDGQIHSYRFNADLADTAVTTQEVGYNPGFDALVQLASLLSAAIPLMRYANSGHISPEQRSAFRELLGQENLFACLIEFQALQSERARRNRK